MRIIHKLLPFLTLLILVITFFNKTLTGSKFFITPDFGGSDILMAEYPTKFFLAELLKQHQWPLWNPQIATGFPLAALTGLFNPVNLILFYFLEPPVAFNLGLAITFLTAGIFTYLFCRSLNLSRFSSLLAATSFSFSGIFVTQINHFTVIQTLSFFPIELYLIEIYIQKRRLSICVLLAFAVGLQILTGFFQVVLYSLIVLTIYAFLRIFYVQNSSSVILTLSETKRKNLSRSFVPQSGTQDDTKQKWTLITALMIAFIFGFLVAAVQLLPSWEFTQISTRSSGVSPEEIRRFPYPVKHLVTFLWPYLLGDPRQGSYPTFNKNWGIFWENTGYLGILPVILAITALVAARKYRHIILFASILLVSLLLMLGKNSPTFSLFQFPPLSLFRVPARWIMFFTFTTSILAAYGLEIFQAKFKTRLKPAYLNLILITILATSTTSLFFFSYNYNPRGQTDKWLAQTQTADFLKNDQSLYRIDSGGNAAIWNEQFLKKGWLSQKENYLTFLEVLEPNFNIIFGIDHVSSYPVIQSQRSYQINYLRDQDVKFKEFNLAVDPVARNLLDLQNVKYFIAPYNFSGRDMDLVFKTQTQPPYYVYQNKTVFPRAFIVTNWEYAPTLQEQYQILSSSRFNPAKTAILEKTLTKNSFRTKDSSVNITKYENQNVQIEAQTDNGGILVLADSFYPGWKAYVDGREAEILAANINQRAVVLEKGKHTVQFVYKPESFKKGAAISLASSVTLLALLIVLTCREKTKSA